jgi:hypothetical protein
MSETRKEFKDDGEYIYNFGDEFLVECPKCRSLAQILFSEEPEANEPISSRIFSPKKLVCPSCGLNKKLSGDEMRVRTGGSFDMHFGLPLWLQIPCCGDTLWAYNEKHLEFIENYVAAKLRVRRPNINQSFISRLPQWLKSAKNRAEILRAIAKLRGKLNGKS